MPSVARHGQLNEKIMTHPSCNNCPLRQTPGFNSNTVEEVDFIQRFKQRERIINPGDAILRKDESSPELFTLLSGWAFRYHMLRDGRRQILNFLLPGDFIGLQEELEGKTPHGVEALTGCTLCVFPRKGLRELYREHPGLAYDLTWICSHEELIVDENLISVGRRTALERVAMLLVHLYRRAEASGLKTENGIPLPITQQHIADALGLSLVHTNKTLRRLHAAGLHELSGGYLKLGNVGAMQRLAEYQTLPRRPRPLI